jgi:mRNA-degrading endonuclease RelE of RelBE toxin-antitoxin system
MSDEKKENEIEVRQTRVFKKAYKRLSQNQQDLVDDEIDKIIENPDLGTRKKGNLSHLWVHKFKMNSAEVLLGYSWNEGALVITLMNVGPHENFYEEAKKRRAADLKAIK